MLAAQSPIASTYPKPSSQQSDSLKTLTVNQVLDGDDTPIIITPCSPPSPSNSSINIRRMQLSKNQSASNGNMLLQPYHPTQNSSHRSEKEQFSFDISHKDFGTYGYGAPNPPKIDLEWRRFDPFDIPDGAFSSGVDSSGHPIYVIRAYHSYAYHIGSYSSSHGAKIPFGGKAIEPEEPQILILDPDMVEWVMVNGPLCRDFRQLASAVTTTSPFSSTSSSTFSPRPHTPILPTGGIDSHRHSLDLYRRFQLPRGCVPIIGGRENHGTDLYIARCLHRGSWVSGKMSSVMEACHFAWDQKELTEDQYQILCFKRF